MGVARSFRDLRVYQLARKAVSEIFEVAKSFPREERHELTGQIRRSARATKALIAEGSGNPKRRTVDGRQFILHRVGRDNALVSCPINNMAFVRQLPMGVNPRTWQRMARTHDPSAEGRRIR